MNKISIVIPIYNVEKYLPQCLDSVINQTHQNLEIILVNDGSTDSCGEIGEEYAAKDPRIKVIHKENGGLSDARNAGIKVATGEYIAFIDSDDFVAVDFCEKLLETLLENTADVAECDFLAFENDRDLEKFSTDTKEKIEVFETEAALELLMKEYFKQTVWNKLYRREVLGDFEFPVGKINEDERVKGIIDVLINEFEINNETIAIYSGLELGDLQSFMNDTNSVSCEKKYKLAVASLFLHYLLKK